MGYNVLVTAISGDIANGILKILQNYDKVDNLYGTDIYDYPVGLNKVNKFYKIIPCAEREQYIIDLLAICDECNIDLLIPTNEKEIKAISDYRNEFQEKKIKLLIHNAEIYDIFLDKYRTAKMINLWKLPSIETYCIGDYNGQLKYPIIVKGRFSNGSRDVHLVENEEDFKRIVYDSNLIVQKYIGVSEEEYTVPVVSFDGGKSIKFIPFKRKLSRAGYTSYVESVSSDKCCQIEKICRVIAQNVKLYGSIDLQMRYADGDFYIFECNPRISGTVGFRDKLGFQDVIWWMEFILENRKDFNWQMPIEKYIGIRELNEIIL